MLDQAFHSSVRPALHQPARPNSPTVPCKDTTDIRFQTLCNHWRTWTAGSQPLFCTWPTSRLPPVFFFYPLNTPRRPSLPSLPSPPTPLKPPGTPTGASPDRPCVRRVAASDIRTKPAPAKGYVIIVCRLDAARLIIMRAALHGLLVALSKACCHVKSGSQWHRTPACRQHRLTHPPFHCCCSDMSGPPPDAAPQYA
jgi:hypothetical protein